MKGREREGRGEGMKGRIEGERDGKRERERKKLREGEREGGMERMQPEKADRMHGKILWTRLSAQSHIHIPPHPRVRTYSTVAASLRRCHYLIWHRSTV